MGNMQLWKSTEGASGLIGVRNARCNFALRPVCVSDMCSLPDVSPHWWCI